MPLAFLFWILDINIIRHHTTSYDIIRHLSELTTIALLSTRAVILKSSRIAKEVSLGHRLILTVVPHLHHVQHADQEPACSHLAPPRCNPRADQLIVPSEHHHAAFPPVSYFTGKGNQRQELRDVDLHLLLFLNSKLHPRPQCARPLSGHQAVRPVDREGVASVVHSIPSWSEDRPTKEAQDGVQKKAEAPSLRYTPRSPNQSRVWAVPSSTVSKALAKVGTELSSHTLQGPLSGVEVSLTQNHPSLWKAHANKTRDRHMAEPHLL